MQIFWPEPNYQASAMALDDRRLRCQIKELGQILSTAIWIEDCGIAETLTAEGCIYLPGHENHPIIRNCRYYYIPAIQYMDTLIREYSWRFNKIHNGYKQILVFWAKAGMFKDYKEIQFQNHTTYHKHIDDVNAAYRLCLIEKWKSETPKWTNRKVPAWAENTCY